MTENHTVRGTGVMTRPKTLEVTIPAGVRHGSVIRLAGQGEPGTGQALAGDLFLHVQLRPHPLFHVLDEGDMERELPVAPWEATLGAKISAPYHPRGGGKHNAPSGCAGRTTAAFAWPGDAISRQRAR